MPQPEHNDPSKYCLGCGYLLTGLVEPRCPECGRGFDPDDPSTFLPKLRSGRFLLVAAFLGLLAMIVPLTVAELNDHGLLDLGRLPRFVVIAFFMPMMPVGFAIEAVVADRCYRALFRTPGQLRSRTPFIWAFVISLCAMAAFAVALLLLS